MEMKNSNETSSSLSLNKAANLLGCNELNKFDYKSLNSIRKLAKTFGCNEYDLMKSFSNLNSLFETECQESPVKNDKTFKRTIVNRKLPQKVSNTNTNPKPKTSQPEPEQKSENHLTKLAQRREIVLYKDDNLGFGFIAGSEKPLKIRFVTPDGPGKNKLLNGDEILSVNDEDVEFASRDYVINLIRASKEKIKLIVKQPTLKSTNSLLLTEDKKAFRKEINSHKKNKVRFKLDNDPNETEIEIKTEPEKIEAVTESDKEDFSILRVYLESQAIKSFKYDKNTLVRDVLNCLKEKLAISSIEYFGLVVCLSNDFDCISKYILVDETQPLHKLKDKYGEDSLCMFRFLFVPNNYKSLIENDENAFNYLYEQSVNDVLNERFGSELKYEMILHLSTLSILHEICDFDDDSDKPGINLDEFELENFLPKSLLESNVVKKHDLHKLLIQNINWYLEKMNSFNNKKNLKLEYLNCMKELLQFSGRIFFVYLLLLSLAKFDSIENIRVSNHNQSTIRIDLDLFETSVEDDEETIINKTISFGLLKNDYLEFLYLLQGYMRLFVYPFKNRLCPIQEIKSDSAESLNVPVYLVKHPCFRRLGEQDLSLTNYAEDNSSIREKLHKELLDKFVEKPDADTSDNSQEDQVIDYETIETDDFINSNIKFESLNDLNNNLDNESLALIESFQLIIQNDVEDDIKSISSIEGSLKASNCFEVNSSTPLIHLYPKLETENPSCLCEPLGNLKKMEYLDENERVEVELEQEVESYLFRDFENDQINNLDVIDLTQYTIDTYLTAPPPPEQFSDDYQDNKFAKHELEIESGIDSDSSSDINQAVAKSPQTSKENESQNDIKNKDELSSSTSTSDNSTSNKIEISNDKHIDETETTTSLKTRTQNGNTGTDPDLFRQKLTSLSQIKSFNTPTINQNTNTYKQRYLKRSSSFLHNDTNKMTDSNISLSSSSASSSGVSSTSSSPTTKATNLISHHSLSVKTIAKQFESNILPSYTRPNFKSSVIRIINQPTPSQPSSPKKPMDLVAETVTLERCEIIEQKSEGLILSDMKTDINIEQAKVIISANFKNCEKISNSIFNTATTNTSKKPHHSSSFHRVLNRLVETKRSSSKSKGEEHKFELINGYDDGSKKKTYSISHSLPSRNFKSILDLFKSNSSSKSSQNSAGILDKSKIEHVGLDHLKNKIDTKDTNTEIECKTDSSLSSAIFDLLAENEIKLTENDIKFRANKQHSDNIVNLFKNLNLIETQRGEEEHLTTFKTGHKKGVLKDPQSGKSSLKVRWKDSIQISNILIEDKYFDDEDINDVYDEEVNLDIVDLNEGDEDEESFNSSDLDEVAKLSKILIDKKCPKEFSTNKQEQFDLQPLHSVGKEFEDEMLNRIEKLQKISEKLSVSDGAVGQSVQSEEFFNEIFSDLDSVLYELHSTIEHVRLSSMFSSLSQLNVGEISSEVFKKNLEENVNQIALICREFVQNAKAMISSALVDDIVVRPLVRQAMNSLSLLVKKCFEICFKFMYKNEKLDEIRQLFGQILSLLNTFRNTLNTSYLAANKQLNDTQMSLLKRQAQSLANEISLLIKHFKFIF